MPGAWRLPLEAKIKSKIKIKIKSFRTALRAARVTFSCVAKRK